MAVVALERRNEIEYIKLVTTINAIIHAGNAVVAAVTGQTNPEGDALKKSLEGVRKMLLPQNEEALQSKAERAKELLTQEASKGPLKIKAVGTDQKRSGRVRIRRKG